MTGFAKFLVGAAGTSLLAWGAHALSGAGYIDQLEARGQAMMADNGLDDVSLTMQRDPLSRVAVLDGITDPDQRAKAEATALKATGISAVRWADETSASGGANADGADGTGGGEGTDAAVNATAGASEAQVVDCQTDVDDLLEDKVITFRSGSAYMPNSSLAIVDQIAELLGECAGMAISIGGHTDATGHSEINQSVSQARADAVAAALVERGVGETRITATGFGSSQPVVEGDGANEANRRIEFTLSNGDGGE
ncbi:MAG: OmpA family protein [Pseudomonadota bacterium]